LFVSIEALDRKFRTGSFPLKVICYNYLFILYLNNSTSHNSVTSHLYRPEAK